MSSTDWTTFNSKENALTFSTGLTRSVNTITVNTTQNIAKLSNLTSNGFVKTSGGDGTLSIDTNTYLTANQTITLSGDVSGSGATSITATIENNAVTFAKMQNITSGVLLGRSTALSGNIEEISIGTGLTLSGGTLSNSLNLTGYALLDSSNQPFTTSGVTSLDTTNRRLVDSSGYTAFDWQLKQFKDSGNVLFLDGGYRQLYNTAGSVVYDFSTSTFSTGQTINSEGTGVKTLVLKQFSGQTANMQEWQNSSGTSLLSITKDGYIVFGANAMLIGSSNSSGDVDDVIVGRSNTVTGSHEGAVVFGKSNTGSGQRGLIAGTSCSQTGGGSSTIS